MLHVYSLTNLFLLTFSLHLLRILFCFAFFGVKRLILLIFTFPFLFLHLLQERIVSSVLSVSNQVHRKKKKKVETETLSLKEKKPEAATKREILNFMKNLLVSHQRRGEKFAESLEVKKRQEDWLLLLVLFLSRTLSIN